MNKLAVVVLALALLMTFAAVPVFAKPPFCCASTCKTIKRGTFNQGIVQVEVSPGKSWMTDDVLHVRGGISASYLYGAPWGNSLSGTGGKLIALELNTVTATGYSWGPVYDTYAAGRTVGIIYNKFTGFGPYTYMGPTFSFTLSGISGTVTHGDTYFGILFTGFGVKYGVSGALKGLKTMDTYTGVLIEAGPLAGVVLIDNTVTYKLPG